MEDQYCRLCMSEDNLTDMEGPILNCVQNVFSIVIHNQELSNEICETCKEFVSKIVEFKEKVNRTQKLLQKILKIKVNNADIDVTYNVKDDIRVDKYLKVEPALPVEKSRKTNKTDAVADSTDTNVISENLNELISKSIKSNNLDEVLCNVCKKTFGCTESLEKHIQKHHNGIHFCTHCNFTSISTANFTAHLRKHYNLTYKHRVCSTCFKVCDSHTDLITHRKTIHQSEVLLVCTICAAAFSNLSVLEKHERDVHRTEVEEASKKMLMCHRCNRGFTSLLVLEKHQCTALKFPCVKKCGKRFESFSMMERHSLKCTSGVTIYSCKKCNKILKTLASLKAHVSKCILKISPAPSSKLIEPQISPVNEPEKKIEKSFEDHDEKVREFCSPVIQRPRTEIDAVSNKRRVDSAEDTTNRKMKRQMQCTESAPEPDSSTQMYSNTPSPLPAKINEINERTPKKTDNNRNQSTEIQKPVNNLNTSSFTPKQNDIDRSTIQSDVPTNNRVSSTSSERSNSRWDRPYKQKIRWHVSTSYNTPKMPDRNRYPKNSNNPFSSAHNPFKTPVTKSLENSVCTTKLPRSQEVVNAHKKNDQLTIIQNSQSICQICKNPCMHLFCNPCKRCFLKNEVQYSNHMKMKHHLF